MTSRSLDFDNPQQPYRQVADDLRTSITSGQLPVGEQLKSVRELAREYGVSPGTVQQALRVLREQGFVTTWQGRGTFVRASHPGNGTDTAMSGEEIIEHLDTILGRLDRLEGKVAALEGDRPKRHRPGGRRDG